MPDAIITSTESTFGTISGTFAADQSTVTGTITGIITGTLDGSVGVPGPTGATGPAGPQGPAGEGVPAGGLEGQILLKASDTSYDTVWADNSAETLTATVRNETGATLSKGTVVYITGAAGNKALVSKASASSEATSSKTFAILAQDIPNNQNGTAVTVGLLKGLNTSGLTEGGSLWLSTTAGQWTQTMPTAPNHAVFLGTVTRVHANQGTVEVRIQNGYELQELHNVKITSVANGQVLKYDSAQSLWVNGTDVGVPAGGTAGQFLQKIDSTDYNTDWVTVNLSAYLAKANNLSDLTNLATSRTNLGLGTANTVQFTEVRAFGSEYKSYVTTFGFTNSRTYSGPSGTIVNYGILTSDDGINLVKEIGNPAQATATVKAGDGMVVNDGDGSQMTFGSTGITFPDATSQTTAFPGFAGYATESFVTSQGYITSAALTGYATESWVTSQGYLTASSLTPYLTKADNLGSLTNFATARDNLGLGTLNTPTFAGVNVPGSGTSVANLGATSLTINQDGYGQFTIQPSQGIVFPDTTIQTSAVNATVLGDYLTKAGNLSGLANTGTARTNLGLGTLSTVNDAPSDGNEYVRKNAAWSVATGGGGGGGVDVQTFGSSTSSGSFTWTKPAGAKWVEIFLWSGGGGGSSGARQATTSTRSGGGGGGAGTFYHNKINASFLGSTETVIVGAGGAGGAARTTNGNANAGSTGGETRFSSYMAASGLGSLNGNNPGAGRTSALLFTTAAFGAGGTASAANGNSGASRNADQTLASGGGAGGSAAANVTTAASGGNGGAFSLLVSSAGIIATVSGGSGGTVAGVAATNGTSAGSEYVRAGTGGGGGFYITGQAGGNGGNGGWPGGGGGGGGACDDSVGLSSGKGGDGANGYAVIITYF